MQTYQNQNTLMVFYGPKLDKYENSSKDTLTMHTHAHHANSQMAKDIEGKKKRQRPREGHSHVKAQSSRLPHAYYNFMQRHEEGKGKQGPNEETSRVKA